MTDIINTLNIEVALQATLRQTTTDPEMAQHHLDNQCDYLVELHRLYRENGAVIVGREYTGYNRATRTLRWKEGGKEWVQTCTPVSCSNSLTELFMSMPKYRKRVVTPNLLTRIHGYFPDLPSRPSDSILTPMYCMPPKNIVERAAKERTTYNIPHDTYMPELERYSYFDNPLDLS